MTEDWDWLEGFDPASVERERFNIPNAGVLRNREGIHLGELHHTPTTINVRVLKALTSEREREERERHRIEVRGQMHARIRELEQELARERRDHAKDAAWRQKLATLRTPATAGVFSYQEAS